MDQTSVDRSKVHLARVSELKANSRNARTHSRSQIKQIRNSIERFGFTSPILIDVENTIVAGHGRVQAAKLLGMDCVPAIRLEHLTPDEVRVYALTDNKLALLAGWDQQTLAIELQHLQSLDTFEIELTGFSVPEIDLILQERDQSASPREEVELDLESPAVTSLGDIWQLGPHRIVCGDSRRQGTYDELMSKKPANVAITDPPFNLRIADVCGKGAIHHREFVMGSGEMTEAEFTIFLTGCFRLLAKYSVPGSVHFIFMDWRHLNELLAAGNQVFDELLNLCVWTKDSPGMGSLYRSQHELVFVFRNGNARHRNNIRLGRFGRNRSNIWRYPGVKTFSRYLDEGSLSTHPTTKPITLVADALLDCSARREIVLDPFLGSGTTLLAAERVGRICRAIEIDPQYVDVAVRRWQKLTGERATHLKTGKTFDELCAAKKAVGYRQTTHRACGEGRREINAAATEHA